MRILGVDYGSERIGLALADNLGRVVRALTTLPAHGIKRDTHRILELAQENHAHMIVVGLPFQEDKADSVSARRARKLAHQLGRLTPKPITLWNEHLTSKAADQWMEEHEIKPDRRRQIRDQIAACLILEDFLASGCHHDECS